MDEQLSASYALCFEWARRAASNFYPTFWALPRADREAMFALYAFFRQTDDIVDSNAPPANRHAQLELWRQQLDQALAALALPRNQRTFPSPNTIWPAVTDVVERYAISPSLLRDAIAGAAMDLAGFRFATFEQLERYCYHVAGTVGLACLRVWNCHNERARAPAEACGVAFQLTNILRDLAEDARRGRFYLPADDMNRFGVTERSLSEGIYDECCAALLQFEINRAREYYHRGAALFAMTPDPGRRVLRGMFATYEGLLDEIDARGGNVFQSRARLSWRRKLSIAAALWWPGASSATPLAVSKPSRASHVASARGYHRA